MISIKGRMIDKKVPILKMHDWGHGIHAMCKSELTQRISHDFWNGWNCHSYGTSQSAEITWMRFTIQTNSQKQMSVPWLREDNGEEFKVKFECNTLLIKAPWSNPPISLMGILLRWIKALCGVCSTGTSGNYITGTPAPGWGVKQFKVNYFIKAQMP